MELHSLHINEVVKINWAMWIWYAVAIVSMFYVLFQVNYGNIMTWREVWFFFLGMFITGVPFVYLMNQ